MFLEFNNFTLFFNSRAIMSHKKLTDEMKKKLCITDNLVKISVGLENICDLICDLENALKSIEKHMKTNSYV